MEEILSLRDKHLDITAPEIRESLVKKIHLIDNIRNCQQQQLNEIQSTIQDLVPIEASLKANLQNKNQIIEHKNQELAKYAESAKELDCEHKRLLEEIKALEVTKHKLKTSKPSVNDQKLLERGRRRFHTYKELTGIRWDFQALPESTTGYITNNVDYIHHFSYKDESDNKLADLLWKEIEKSTVKECSAEKSDEENVPSN